MPGPTSPRWRQLRSAAFAVVAAWLAAVGHAVGGGGTPDPAILLVGAGGIGLICTGLGGVRRRWAGIFGVLGGCQLMFHLLFSVGGHSMAGSHPLMPAHPLRMLLFHLLAAALSALVLATGDAALFGLFAAIRRSITLIGPPVAVDVPPRWTPSFAGFFWPRPAGAMLSTSPRRGPPAGLG